MSSMQNPAGFAALFQQQLNIYQTIKLHNYMQHKALSAVVNPWHTNAFGLAPISLLDIGAGDAKQIAGQKPFGIRAQYTGIDLSETALALAVVHLQAADIPASLHCNNFNELVPQLVGQHHVVYSAFALYHASNQEKQDLLQHIERLLLPKGQFIWMDIFPKDNQPREACLQAYLQRIAQWHALSADDKKAFESHLLEFAFPCSVNDAIRWSRMAGLSCVRAHMADDVHGVLVLQKK